MANPLYLNVSFETLTCPNKDCGITFAVPEHFAKSLRRSKKSFFCPQGHSQWFPGPSEEDKLRERLRWAEENAKRHSELREHAERSASAFKGHMNRAKAKLCRVKHGVCPCCNRTFQNLKRHMASQHPEFEHE